MIRKAIAAVRDGPVMTGRAGVGSPSRCVVDGTGRIAMRRYGWIPMVAGPLGGGGLAAASPHIGISMIDRGGWQGAGLPR
jgi:hypothetical protein